MNEVITFLKSKKKYRLTPGLERAAMPLMIGAGLLIVASLAGATVLDSIGNYVDQGVTGPFAKGTATGLVVLGSFGMHRLEGRGHTVAMGTAFSGGGVLAAPTIVNEFQHALGGVLIFSHGLLGLAGNLAHFF